MEKGNTEKKRLWIYLAVAYGITFLMGILMWYGNARGADVGAFPNAQMMYPAAGVMLGLLLTKKGDKTLPKGLYILFLLLTAVMIGVSVISVFAPKSITVNGITISVWEQIINNVIIIGGILFWIFLLIAGKEKRKAYGLNWDNWEKSWWCILLFVLLFFGRTALSCAVSGQLGLLEIILTTPSTWIMIAVLFVNFFPSVPAFFGEEYGWRYYLQPLLQKKFGLKGGVIVLGVVWGLWHLPVDFFYYTTPDQGFLAVIGQQITCITLGIFFAYAYMKTKNIWVPVVLHFLNNNLAAILSGGGADALQNQTYTWSDLFMALVVNALFFGIFIFAGCFRKKDMVKEEEKKDL